MSPAVPPPSPPATAPPATAPPESAPPESAPPTPACAPDDALVLEGVRVSYGGVNALDGVNAHLHHGGSLALIGPNGAGKSTLIKAVLGIIPLDRGSITVLGRSPRAARADVAYVPQSGVHDPEFPVSVGQVAIMGRYRRVGWLRRPGRQDKAIAASALEQVGMAALAERRFGALSGGQQQRVLLARAIAQQAELLLLDEPFNGVDARTQEAMLEVLRGLQAQGVALVMSTHDLTVAHLACGETCLLNRHQVAFGPTAEVLSPERLRDAYGPAAVSLADEPMVVADPVAR